MAKHEPTGPSLEWLLGARIKRAKEQAQSYSALLGMVEKEEIPEQIEEMLIKLLLAMP